MERGDAGGARIAGQNAQVAQLVGQRAPFRVRTNPAGVEWGAGPGSRKALLLSEVLPFAEAAPIGVLGNPSQAAGSRPN